jgi:DNA-binding response OmpR family regulator
MGGYTVAKGEILIVDDEPNIIRLISMYLEREGFGTLAARSGSEAIEMVTRHNPSLVILDIMLPDVDGWEVCRELRRTSDVPIIMLTAKGELQDRVAGLDGGADDYIVKPFRFQELLARVRAVLRRRGKTLHQVLRYADVVLNRDTREVWRNGVAILLTPREFDVLELFLAHPRQVFSRETILNRLWGYHYIGDTNVVEVHISSLREKLGDTDRRLIQTVRGVGYCLRLPGGG